MAIDRQVRAATGGMAPGGDRSVTPGAVAEAARVMDQAEARLRRWDTPLEAALLAVVDRRWTDEVATMAVQLRPDGIATLLANPAFVIEVGADGTAFVLCHEALHLLFAHLREEGERDDAWELACEVVINHWVTHATGRPLPRSIATGGTVGIDPRQVHADYAAAVSDPVDYGTFVLTDEGCVAHLRAMTADTRPTPDACDHHLPELADQGVDGEHAGEAVERVLEQAVARATDGDELVRQRLLDLEQIVPDAPAWGRIGVSELRSTTTRLGGTWLWQAQLAHVLGEQLRPDLELRYDRKTGWWDHALLAAQGIDLDPDVGMPLQLVASTHRHRHVAIYLDTSGSVPEHVVEAAAATVGRIPDATVDWHTFDHEVHPFTPGEELIGGGGTCFGSIVDDLDAETTLPDAVLVLTDGYAPPIDPPRPERWIWLIVAHGDPWPRDRGMRTVQLTDLGDE